MKPLPDLNDKDAMARRGRLSALGSARNEAAQSLRDACTMAQSSDWDDLHMHAEAAEQAAARLKVLAAMWQSVE